MTVLLDNKSQGKVGDALAEGIRPNACISILSSLFSIFPPHLQELVYVPAAEDEQYDVPQGNQEPDTERGLVRHDP